MKGIMVPLLVFSMTGIVVGQQQTSSNNFGGADFNPASNSSSQSVSPNELKPIEIQISSDDILGLRQGKILTSKIAPTGPDRQPLPKSVVNGVVLLHQSNDGRAVQSKMLRARDDGDGILRFPLTDVDLRNLQSKRLSYDLDFTKRGRYDYVKFYYVEPTSALAGPTPDNDNGNSPIKFGPTAGSTGQSSRNNQFGTVRTTPITPSMLPTPGPIEPGEIDFMGPVRPSRLATRPQQWGPVASGNTNPALNTQPATNGLSLSEYQQKLAQEKARQDLLERQARDKELRRQLAAREANRTNQFGGMQTKPAATPTPATQGFGDWNNLKPIRPTQSDLGLNAPETALTADQQRFLQQKAAAEREYNQRVTDLLAYQKELADKEARLQQQVEFQKQQDYLRSIQTRPFPGSNSELARGMVEGTDMQPGPVIEPDSRYGITPSRGNDLASNTTSGQRRLVSNSPPPKRSANNDLTLSVNGRSSNNQSKTSGISSPSDKKEMGFIYFMLLCSLGLNIYLAWISRGFYVRYHELADELRETFTSTV